MRVIKAESNDKYIVLALERVTSAIAFPPTTHCRYIVFWKSPTIVLFFDFICGSASTTYSLGLHFSSDLIIVNDLRSNCPCLKLRNSSQEVVTLSFFSLPGTVLLKDVQVSPSYGVRLPAKKVQIDFEPIADKTCLIYAFCSSKDAEFCREIATMMSKSFLCEAPL